MDWGAVGASVENLLASQTGLVTSFTWGGKTYSGVRTNLKREVVALDAGLYEGGYEFSLLCGLSQFTSGYPADRMDTISVGGKTYRVLSTDTDSIQATIRLNLGAETA